MVVSDHKAIPDESFLHCDINKHIPHPYLTNTNSYAFWEDYSIILYMQLKWDANLLYKCTCMIVILNTFACVLYMYGITKLIYHSTSMQSYTNNNFA